MLGLKGVAFKAHGSSNALAVFRALCIANEFIESNMVERLGQVLQEHSDAPKTENTSTEP
jgi:Fatty acid/phospholipid biosynthesis enzyme